MGVGAKKLFLNNNPCVLTDGRLNEKITLKGGSAVDVKFSKRYSVIPDVLRWPKDHDRLVIKIEANLLGGKFVQYSVECKLEPGGELKVISTKKVKTKE